MLPFQERVSIRVRSLRRLPPAFQVQVFVTVRHVSPRSKVVTDATGLLLLRTRAKLTYAPILLLITPWAYVRGLDRPRCG